MENDSASHPKGDKFPAIEQQIFEWKGWAETAAPGSLEFEDVTLKVDVGEHKAGTHFDAAFLSSSTSSISFKNYSGENFTYLLIVKPGSKVDPEEIFGNHPDGCGCGHDHDSN